MIKIPINYNYDYLNTFGTVELLEDPFHKFGPDLEIVPSLMVKKDSQGNITDCEIVAMSIIAKGTKCQ